IAFALSAFTVLSAAFTVSAFAAFVSVLAGSALTVFFSVFTGSAFTALAAVFTVEFVFFTAIILVPPKITYQVFPTPAFYSRVLKFSTQSSSSIGDCTSFLEKGQIFLFLLLNYLSDHYIP